MRVWAHGRLIDADDPVYTAADPVPTHGLGLFETCAVRDGVVLDLGQHLARLTRSAAALGLTVDLGQVRAGVEAVLDAHVGRVRITVGSSRGPVVVAGPREDRPHPTARRSPWVRNERSPLAGHKSTSYAADALALADARRHGADEALLADTRGHLSEGSTSNVWVEIDGELLTPSLDSGCLPGIMRELVLDHEPTARATQLPWSVLDRVSAGEAGLAISNALRGLVPVSALDGVPVAVTPLIARAGALIRRR
ncbi:aminotransferase class IV [Cellulomonas sp. NPDC089187]|uniref:aminotransferase class IV n=1 Tax=Cellulomonas sp. NPDC089187 TaxID=3154970 RepID=UPI003429FEAE